MLNNGYILTAAEMLQAEQTVMDTGLSIHELMKRAGTGAAQQVMRVLSGRKVLVICGPGNNGGDGYVIAQYIREHGISVSVAAMCEPKTEAAQNARSSWAGETFKLTDAIKADCVIDCLFGTGLTRAIKGDLLDNYLRLLTTAALRIAVDIPSGIQSDTGELLNPIPEFDLTIALGAYKPAHFLEPAKSKMGQLCEVDIGIKTKSSLSAIQRPELLAPETKDHKYTRGLIGVVAGQMPGAAKLAALAAQNSGAGYVKIFAADDAASPRNSIVTESYCDHDDLTKKISDARISALVIGPGLGRDDTARARLNAALSTDKHLVLDADALVLLGKAAEQKIKHRNNPVVITPHQGEFAALGYRNKVSRIEDTRSLSGKSGAVVLLKGADTVIANPSGQAGMQQHSCTWLSTAGTGDVLSGIIAARLAIEADVFVAVSQAQWLHTRAAQLAGPSFSPEMLIDQISNAIQECL